MIKIPTIKGPIKIKKGSPLPKEILERAAKNLPFEAENWKSAENEYLVTGKESKGKKPKEEKKVEKKVKAKKVKPARKAVKEEVKGKNDSNKLLDNYLDQNTKTVIKALKEDSFNKKVLEDLYTMEKLDKNREKVLEAIKELVEA